MPELPEVETMCRDLEAYVQGQSVTNIKVLDARVVHQPKTTFVRRLKGQHLRQFRRRGKAILCDLDQNTLLIQPMMTGYVFYNPPETETPILKETKLVLMLSKGGQLLYNDQRLFGQVRVIQHEQESSYLTHIGPEPLTDDFNVETITHSLKRRRVPIKQALLDHKCIAGIGNIYASEILFEAGIHPMRSSCDLSSTEIEKLVVKTKTILQEAIALRGCSMRNYRDSRGEKGQYMSRIRVYGRAGDSCPCSDGGVIEKVVMAGRSTFFCSQCQY